MLRGAYLVLGKAEPRYQPLNAGAELLIHELQPHPVGLVSVAVPRERLSAIAQQSNMWVDRQRLEPLKLDAGYAAGLPFDLRTKQFVNPSASGPAEQVCWHGS